MNTVSVSVVNLESGETFADHCALVQLEAGNTRIYVQPVEGEPQRIPLLPGDSVIITIE